MTGIMAKKVAAVITTAWGGKNRYLARVFDEEESKSVRRDSGETIKQLANTVPENEEITAF